MSALVGSRRFSDRVLVFDLGGVLVVNDLFGELAKMMPRVIDQEALKGKWLRSTAVREFELGRCTPEKFASEMVEEFELSVAPHDFIAEFTGWPKGFHVEANDLLKNLRKHYQTACLSNSNVLHWTTHITSHFDYSYSSHLLNRIKPDADVFEFVTADIGRDAKEIVFFDDSLANVVAAKAFGWEAYLTDGFAELKRVLSEMKFTA